jgi:hypothetical protein
VEVFEVFVVEVELALVDEVCCEGDGVVDVVEFEGAVEDGRILVSACGWSVCAELGEVDFGHRVACLSASSLAWSAVILSM